MGLTKHGDGGVFLSIADGKLVQQHKEPRRDVTTTRITKTGKTVHEEKFDYIEGKLFSLKTKENDYGKQYILGVQDGDDKFYINISYSSRYATSFLKALPNIDASKPVKLMPWSMTDKNDATKKITGITMWQDGEKIAPFYTKEAPNGLPEMVQVKLKGKMQWDSTDMDAFLEAMAMKKFGEDEQPTQDQESSAKTDPFCSLYMPTRINIVGNVYGRLMVIEYSHTHKGFAHWRCQCDCGNIAIKLGHHLKNGNIKGCGQCTLVSKNLKHGFYGTKEYRAWHNIKRRCYDKNSRQFKWYGARGISVCDRWLESFLNFLSDVGMAPSEKHSIARIDNNGNYEPSNVKLSTSKEQNNNRRNNIKNKHQWDHVLE